MSSKLQNKEDWEIKVSEKEKEILREIVRSEKASLQIFSLPSKKENNKYQKLLNRLDSKLT